ncbi:MAG: DUF86 domain-containing protein [Mesorhizobium sp.]|nr:HepT-like ribonuclease domain-containing protein [Mesorhizobium sp.]MCO5159560.1 DUF86 domain-containing protein [Mesorhizobium sp.]
MARRDTRIVLGEMVDTIDEIAKALEATSFEAFSGNWVLKHAVQRGIEIISEAARHLPEELSGSEPDIPWKQIRGVGNVLRHEYHRISDRIIWNVIQNELPSLREAILRIAQRDIS